MLYEYRCLTHELAFEVEQSIKDPPLVRCEICSECKPQRLITAAGGFALHGKGWTPKYHG